MEVQRAEQATQLLANPLYNEAYDAIGDRIVSQLTLADLPDDKRKRLNDLLVSLAKIRQYMEQVIFGGKQAAKQVEQEERAEAAVTRRNLSFSERVRGHI